MPLYNYAPASDGGGDGGGGGEFSGVLIENTLSEVVDSAAFATYGQYSEAVDGAYDVGDWFDAAVDDQTIVIPAGVSYVYVAAGARFSVGTGSTGRMRVILNAGQASAKQLFGHSSDLVNFQSHFAGSAVVAVSEGDTINLQVASSGSNGSFGSSNDNDRTFLNVVKMG